MPVAKSKRVARAASGARKVLGVRKVALKRPSAGAKANKAAAPKPKAAPAVLKGLSAVVINLDRRPDRWEGARRSLDKYAAWMPAKRQSAVDGAKKPPPLSDVKKSWSTAGIAEVCHWYKVKTIDMSPGERGCCASHLEAWRLCAKRGKPLVVLEDDMICLPKFTEVLAKAMKEAPPGTGAIWLSSKDRGTTKKAGEVLRTPYYVWTTVGYVLFPAGAKELIKQLPMDAPVDNFMAAHIRKGTIKAFSVRPACVRQANTWNIGSDVPHSDDVAH